LARRRDRADPVSEPRASAEVRFGFGDNWANYARSIGEPELDAAIAGLRRVLSAGFDPQGKRFLDIGCGSGLHAVAAARLGFGAVVCTDYDPQSVATAERTARRFGVGDRLQIFRDDILASRIEGSFDVVYSWGVLHHTGDMWTAIENAAQLVAPGGHLILALYLRTRFCGAWRRIKRLYCVAPPPVQRAMAYGYHAAKSLRQVANGAIFRAYRDERGMDRFYDSVDWLGGYPYESASAAEVEAFLSPRFALETSFSTTPSLGLLGSGCAEYRFRRCR
jgi:2-polyprenyl-6-hydroxyphenyl methylase/3-demethylubiquinone-9 3-methyltransferase